MSIFGNIMSAIFGHSSSAAAAAPASAPGAAPAAPTAQSAPASAQPAASAPAAASAAPVDVTAIMDGLAAKSSEKLDWRRSIVDLMKLINLDSSLAARKELAQELSYQRGYERLRVDEYLAAQASHDQARREWRQGAGRAARLGSAFDPHIFLLEGTPAGGADRVLALLEGGELRLDAARVAVFLQRR